MRDLRFLELIHNIEVRETPTFSQVSAQWYTSPGEEAEGRVQQSCLPSRHLCPPGKHTIWTTHLATGSVYVPIYLSIHRSSIYHKLSVLSICVPIYLLTHLSIYVPHYSGQVSGGSSAVQKSRAGGKGVALHLSPPPPPSHPHTSPLTLTLLPSHPHTSLTLSHFSHHTPHLPSHPHTLPSHPHTSPPHSSQAMEMFTDLRQFDLAKDFLGGSNQKNVKELITKQADWARTTNDPQAAW